MSDTVLGEESLMTADERSLLALLTTMRVTSTPLSAGSELGWSSQKVVKVARPLERGMYIRVRRLPRLVAYEITDAGREALARKEGEDGR